MGMNSLIDPKKKEEFLKKLFSFKKRKPNPPPYSEKIRPNPPPTRIQEINMLIFKSASNGNFREIKRLIDGGADVNARNEYGNTPLIEAAQKGHSEAAKVLIDAGAEVDACNKGRTALISAAGWHKETVELLIAAGADVNAKTDTGGTALLAAAWSSNKEIAELLIAAGADVSASDNAGDTPLMGAAYRGANELVDLLISNGAEINCRNNDGRTALDMVTSSKDFGDLTRFVLGSEPVWIMTDTGGPALPLLLRYREIAEVLISKGAKKVAGEISQKPGFDCKRIWHFTIQ